jgi:hypothetical protein
MIFSEWKLLCPAVTGQASNAHCARINISNTVGDLEAVLVEVHLSANRKVPKPLHFFPLKQGALAHFFDLFQKAHFKIIIKNNVN